MKIMHYVATEKIGRKEQKLQKGLKRLESFLEYSVLGCRTEEKRSPRLFWTNIVGAKIVKRILPTNNPLHSFLLSRPQQNYLQNVFHSWNIFYQSPIL